MAAAQATQPLTRVTLPPAQPIPQDDADKLESLAEKCRTIPPHIQVRRAYDLGEKAAEAKHPAEQAELCKAHQPTAEAAESAGEVLNLAALERLAICRAMLRANGDKFKAAALLGMGKTTLYRKLKEYQIGSLYVRACPHCGGHVPANTPRMLNKASWTQMIEETLNPPAVQ